jgi:DNA-binding CsgD family transcriptional regulator
MAAVFSLDNRSAVDPRALETLFDLSAKQAEMAMMLGQGHGLAAIARRLGIAPDTARSHLKNIFRKLEINRQQDLAVLLAKLATVRC